MILTFKVKHGRDFTAELAKARKVAEFGIEHRTLSSADVKHIGLKSIIANQILKKYAKDKKAKSVRSVALTIPNQGIKVDKEHSLISIPCLKLELPYQFRNDFEKINQIELNSEYAFISVTISEPKVTTPTKWLGVDLNTTGHCVVVGNPETGKVVKMGKEAEHTHKKYKNMRKTFQRNGKYRKVKQIKNREQRVVKDLNHKMSKKIVSMAKENGYGIRLEDLKGIRDNRNAKTSKSFRYSLNSWSFYQLQMFVDYKAKLRGVSVEYIAPEYTSQECSRCGLIGNRNGKDFKCSNCGHVDNADCNASFNIALRQPAMASIYQSNADRDVLEGSTDTPKEAML